MRNGFNGVIHAHPALRGRTGPNDSLRRIPAASPISAATAPSDESLCSHTPPTRPMKVPDIAAPGELQTSRYARDVLAGLRRVATLVARGVSPSEVFFAVADEIARCMEASNASVSRFDGDGTLVLLALGRIDPTVKNKPLIGERFSLEGNNVAATVARVGRAARQDSSQNASGPVAAWIREMGFRCTVGAPIIVDGRVWGMAAVASSGPEPLPPDTEARISDFANLVAAAIVNAASRAELLAGRDELSVLAEQQASLRRVATLVARGVDSSAVFCAVAEELSGWLGVHHHAVLFRYEPDGAGVLLGAGGYDPELAKIPVGERFTLDGESVAAKVFRTGRPARMDSYENAPGSIAMRFGVLGLCRAVGAPIIVDGRLWGTAIIGASRPDGEPLPPDTEARIGDFADLVATAIANAQTHLELSASRARIVAAADDARRGFERDLHDGAQQQLVALGLKLGTAHASVPSELHALKEQTAGILSGLAGISQEVQRISRGIHPAILSSGGLGPALKVLARRCTVPVELDLGVDGRLPESVEVAAYYVVAEALTNAAKHARASDVRVFAETEDANLVLSIQDNGIGGADVTKGSGLIGLKDRVEALGGQMKILSTHTGSGTSLLVTMPLDVN